MVKVSQENRVKYDPNHHPRMAEMLCQRGAVDREIAEFFDIPPSTFYKWRLTHPEFAGALLAGKEIADERVSRSLFNRAVGYNYDAVKIMTVSLGAGEGSRIEKVEYVEHVPPDVKAAIRWLEARRPKEWRRTLGLTGGDGGAIQLSDADKDFSGLNADECANLRTLLEKAAAGPDEGDGES